MTLPKNSNDITDEQIIVRRNFLNEKFEIIVDKNKCIGCGTCSIVCNKDAITFDTPKTSYNLLKDQDIVRVYPKFDANSCVFCATCASGFCAVDAIDFLIDGKKIDKKDFKINVEATLPSLQYEKLSLEKRDNDINVYWKGKISVSEKAIKEAEIKCGEGCDLCKKVCPTNAIEINSKNSIPITIDDKKCIKCSSCMLVCPENILKIEWTDINAKGRYNLMFWKPIKTGLLSQSVKFKEA